MGIPPVCVVCVRVCVCVWRGSVYYSILSFKAVLIYVAIYTCQHFYEG